MRVEICAFMRKACRKYKSVGLQAYYTPKRNLYVFHIRGQAVQNFSEDNFYDLPKDERLRMLEPLVKIGLHTNLGNKNHDMLFANSVGHKIA